MTDGVPMITKLRLEYILEQGYANLRCTHAIGCPVELRPFDPSTNSSYTRDRTQAVFAESFAELVPNVAIPSEVGIPCGSQFGLSRATIHSRPQSDYIRYRDWLYSTNLEDEISGRVMEYIWHIVMGKPAVHCPSAQMCFCGLYGLCELQCEAEGGCRGRYKLPTYARIPEGWPEIGPGKDGWPEREWWNHDVAQWQE